MVGQPEQQGQHTGLWSVILRALWSREGKSILYLTFYIPSLVGADLVLEV